MVSVYREWPPTRKHIKPARAMEEQSDDGDNDDAKNIHKNPQHLLKVY